MASPWARTSANAAALTVVLLASASCVHPTPRTTADRLSKIDISELWEEPRDLPARDLVHGPGGKRLAPAHGAKYTFREADRSGYSKGYDVTGPNGRAWNVKLGPEAQSEVTASRILWAIGYHQPVVYYVPKWTLVGGEHAGPQEPGRFRLDDPSLEVLGDWSWYENDFVGTRPFNGLVVANLIVGNWDWKASNNKVIRQRENGRVNRLYIVRDLGASFGKTTFPAVLNVPLLRMWKQGTRNNIEDFESRNLIKAVRGNRVEFDYRGVYESLVDTITPADVAWTCRLMARITDRQWRDAFRAADYSTEETERFVRKIKSKIGEGLALE